MGDSNSGLLAREGIIDGVVHWAVMCRGVLIGGRNGRPSTLYKRWGREYVQSKHGINATQLKDSVPISDKSVPRLLRYTIIREIHMKVYPDPRTHSVP